MIDLDGTYTFNQLDSTLIHNLRHVLRALGKATDTLSDSQSPAEG